jgi:nicotinamidase-related amidase
MPTALLVIDVQQAFDDTDFWGRRNNPECEANVAALLAAWEGPRVYVRHDSDEPGSPRGIDGLSPARRRRASRGVRDGRLDT